MRISDWSSDVCSSDLANLHRNWVMIPHVTNNDEADITDLEALRVTLNKENEESGVKVTRLAFLIKAVVAGLKKFPEFNSSLDGGQVVCKQYYHIGSISDTPKGRYEERRWGKEGCGKGEY